MERVLQLRNSQMSAIQEVKTDIGVDGQEHGTIAD